MRCVENPEITFFRVPDVTDKMIFLLLYDIERAGCDGCVPDNFSPIRHEKTV